MNAGKGKKQVQLTLTVEAYDRLAHLAKESDRTLAGYLRRVFYDHLRSIDQRETETPE